MGKDVDTDRDGVINFDEFVAFAFDPSLLREGEREQYFHSAFNSIRKGDDGVDRNSFKELFAAEAVPLVDRLFDEIDSDHSGKIEYSEFAKYLLELNRPVEDVRRIDPVSRGRVPSAYNAPKPTVSSRLSITGHVLGSSLAKLGSSTFIGRQTS